MVSKELENEITVIVDKYGDKIINLERDRIRDRVVKLRNEALARSDKATEPQVMIMNSGRANAYKIVLDIIDNKPEDTHDER